MAAQVFHNPEHGILISGDALWENGYGLVMPLEIDPRAMPATRATLDMLAGLDVSIVIPGHGAPFTDVAAALERAYQRTDAFEASSLRVAKYALKALLSFALLDRRRLPLAEMPAYVERVEIYRQFNQRFFRLAPEGLAEMLIAELERAGAARREEGWLLAA
jgi:glyoxylase-like metal-dependent hydrolase (beta-lactamase superfamily II)